MFDFLFPPPKPPGPKTLFDGTVTRFLGKCFLGVACLGLVLVAGILFVGYTSGSPQTRAVCGLLVVILGVPTVGLFGSTDPRWSINYNPHEIRLNEPVPCGPCAERVCPLGHHRCMQELRVERVFDAVQSLLESSRATQAA